MANDVTINIKANTTQAKGALTQFKNGLNDVVTGLTGISLAQASMTGVVIAGGKALRDTIVDYSKYAETVAIFAASTNQSAENASRMIQVADDFRISTNQMESALRLALQNGFVPTIENLAKMSDLYIQTTDANERAKLMQETFGRSWMDLIPLLEAGGEAIRNNAAAVDDSLIITDQAVKQNREFMAQLDNFNDTVEGTKMRIGGGLIPVLGTLLEVLNNTQDSVDNSGAAWMRYIPFLNSVYIAAAGLVELLQRLWELMQGTSGFKLSQIDDGSGNDVGTKDKVDDTPKPKVYDPLTGTFHRDGGSYTIPSGFNENYPVGIGHYASSGEVVTITPKGEGAGISIGVLNVTLPGVTNAKQFADALGAMANNARNSGRAIQGG